MKNWTAPVVEELDVNMTANGLIPYDKEIAVWIVPVTNDSKKEKTPEES